MPTNLDISTFYIVIYIIFNIFLNFFEKMLKKVLTNDYKWSIMYLVNKYWYKSKYTTNKGGINTINVD